MKQILIMLSLAILLISCGKKDMHEVEKEATLPLWMEFVIPESVSEVSNSWAITINWEEALMSWPKLEVWDSLVDVTVDNKADFFDQVWTASINDYKGYKLIETVPSLDTPVCTMQTKQLEFAAKEFPNVDFLIISNDTPFALQRFCAANSITNLQVFSDARTREFGKQNGLLLEDYSLLTRAIMVVDETNEIKYIEYANEVTSELDLMNALAFLKTVAK